MVRDACAFFSPALITLHSKTDRKRASKLRAQFQLFFYFTSKKIKPYSTNGSTDDFILSFVFITRSSERRMLWFRILIFLKALISRALSIFSCPIPRRIPLVRGRGLETLVPIVRQVTKTWTFTFLLCKSSFVAGREEGVGGTYLFF